MVVSLLLLLHAAGRFRPSLFQVQIAFHQTIQARLLILMGVLSSISLVMIRNWHEQRKSLELFGFLQMRAHLEVPMIYLIDS